MRHNQKLENDIKSIMEDYQAIHNRLVSAVLDFVEANPVHSGYYYELHNVDRMLDALAFDRAWVEDRINDGVASYKPHRRSMKVARALGYNAYGR